MQFFEVIPSKKNRFVAQTVNLGRNLKSFEQAPHLRNHTVTSCCSSVVPFTSSQPSISPCAKNATGSEMRQLWVTYSPSSIASFYLSRSFFLNIGKTVMIPSRLLHKNIACFVCQKITWGKMVFKHLWTKQGFRGFPVGFQDFHPKSWDFLTAGPSNAELLILHCVIHQKGEVLTSESRDAQGTKAAVSALWLHRSQNRKEMARKSSRARAWPFKRLKKNISATLLPPATATTPLPSSMSAMNLTELELDQLDRKVAKSRTKVAPVLRPNRLPQLDASVLATRTVALLCQIAGWDLGIWIYSHVNYIVQLPCIDL